MEIKKINRHFLLLFSTSILLSCGGNGSNNKSYTLTLNANGGAFESTSSQIKTISNCTTITRADLEEPLKDNAGFKDWYFDNSKSNAVTFPYTLSSNVTLYAGWNNMPTGDFAYNKTKSVSFESSGNAYTFTVDVPTNNETPTITLEGVLNDAQINIVVSDAMKTAGSEINIVLNGFKIQSTDSLAPINIAIAKADNLFNIISNENTSNYIFDGRTTSSTTEDGDGAINAKTNLKFSGKGDLYLNDKNKYPGFSKAIDTSKNLTIDNTTISAYGVDTSIRGKRSITVNDSKLTIYSKTGTGLKTSDEDVQDGVRCGDININGKSTITCAVAKHGISASRDINITNNENGNPLIDIYTSTYANSYITIGTPSIDEKDMYIQLPSSLSTYADQEEYRFAVLFTDGTTDTWDNATLKKYHKTGGGPGPQPGPRFTEGGSSGVEGYYFGLDRPISATKYQIVLFNKNQDSNPKRSKLVAGTNYIATTGDISLPSSGDTAKITGISGTSITCNSSFGNYTSMIEKDTNSEKASYGCKGLACDNEININNAVLNIRSKDDSITAKYGKLFPSNVEPVFEREIGTGNVNINGDNTVIYIESADDAIHGTEVNIGTNGMPNITIANSYEGLEGGIINYINGSTSIYARDDGVNGSYIGNITDTSLSVNISGGYLDVQVASGDTDGIDSNYNYKQTGGIVVSRASTNNNMSTPLDCDGTANVTNSGVFIALGVTPEASISCSTKKTSISKTFTSNSTHKINNKYSFTVTMSYSQYHYYLGSSASAPTIS